MLTRSPEDNQREGSLTQRDLTLLWLLAAGYNNRQIASELSLAESTVRNSLSAFFQKIGVRDRSQAVLGSAAARFGYDFPIRFDYLDTVDGDNLSIQCHPSPDYALEHFGEPFTQDETYYIVDCEPDARVYLGLRDDIDGEGFRRALERSARDGTEVAVDRFVSSVESRRHDLYLIPHGTVHSAAAGNLVLEISATPYIFTFKMYDWLRRDLDGGMRPLNIERAWENLDLSRTSSYAHEHLVSQPRTLASGEDWRVVWLPTDPDHFYDVHRLDFRSTLTVHTNGRCHLLNLVEGESIVVETANGRRRRVSSAETVIIPAAAASYRLANEGGDTCRVVKAFVQVAVDGAYWLSGSGYRRQATVLVAASPPPISAYHHPVARAKTHGPRALRQWKCDCPRDPYSR